MTPAPSRRLRLAVVIASVLGGVDLAWRIVGAFNRRRPWLESILFCYAAVPEHARVYCFSWAERWLCSRATVIGAYQQGRRWGLILASPVTEAALLKRGDPTLETVLARVSRIAALAGVDDIRLAGILPAHLKRIHHPLEATEPGDVVASAVVAAALHAAQGADLDWYAPVVVIGRGSIGARVSERLRRMDRAFVAIGAAHAGTSSLPETPAVVVDVSSFEVLALYVERLRPGSVVVTDVFPEPPPRLVKRLKERGLRVFHVAGVKGAVFPPLPGVYAEAIPFCALLEHADSTGIVMQEL